MLIVREEHLGYYLITHLLILWEGTPESSAFVLTVLGNLR